MDNGPLFAMRETWLPSLSWEDPLEKEMVTHPSVLAWRIPWTEKPGGLQLWGCKGSDTTEGLTHTQGGGWDTKVQLESHVKSTAV